MHELPEKKVGIITCSGEEIPEGTVTRLAALRVLGELRRGETVTICLPLFLAGGEGDRAFAKYYPTIAVDGCDKRCAFHGTSRYSNQPAASVVISDLVDRNHLEKPAGLRSLDAAGKKAVDLAADEIANLVDELSGKDWSRTQGAFNPPAVNEKSEDQPVTCSCGSGIPVQVVELSSGEELTIIALPLIFEKFREQKKEPSPQVISEIMQMVAVYNRLDAQQKPLLQSAVEMLYKKYYDQEYQ